APRSGSSGASGEPCTRASAASSDAVAGCATDVAAAAAGNPGPGCRAPSHSGSHSGQSANAKAASPHDRDPAAAWRAAAAPQATPTIPYSTSTADVNASALMATL